MRKNEFWLVFFSFNLLFPGFSNALRTLFFQDQKLVIGLRELRSPIFRNKSAVDFEAYPFIILNDQKSLTQKKMAGK
ncbi:MAG: hypothetical protein ACJAUD_001696 [Crocinitomicaceae bacterium]